MRQKIQVLVVDDSAFARFSVSRHLQDDPDIEVIGFGRDGIDGVEKVRSLRPDVVTLDVEMPRMNGLLALEQIMSTCPTPVIMLSSLTGEGTEATIKALELGAIDFFLKHSQVSPAGNDGMVNDLRAKIKVAATAKVRRSEREACRQPAFFDTKTPCVRKAYPANKVVVIGSSTGGPRALYELIPGLPADIPAGVLLIQHMPPGFTKSLAERLNQISVVEVKEAEPGDVVGRGQVIVAPGGYHMTITKGAAIGLNQDKPVCGVRPSVDVTMESVAQSFGTSSLGVVLTGMGTDGTRGTSLIKAVGGRVVAEHESTCTIYGMPRSVIEAGNADRVVPLPQVASQVVKMLKNVEGVAIHG